LQAIRPGEDLTLKFILRGINIIGQDDFHGEEKHARGASFRQRPGVADRNFYRPRLPALENQSPQSISKPLWTRDL